MEDLHWALLTIGGGIILGIYLLSLRHARRREADAAAEAAIVAPPVEPYVDTDTDAADREELRGMSALLAETRHDHPARPTEPPPETDPDPHPSPPLPDEAPIHAARRTPERHSEPSPEAPPPKTWALFGDAAEAPTEPLPELLLSLHVTAPSGVRFSGADIQEALQQAGLRHGVMDIYHRVPHGGTDRDAIFSVADMLEPGALGAERLQDHYTPGLTLFLRLPGPVDGAAALDDMLRAARVLAQRLDGELRDESRSVLTRQTIEHLRERIVEHRRQRELAQRRAHGAAR